MQGEQNARRTLLGMLHGYTHNKRDYLTPHTHKYPMECAVAIERVECDIESDINISVSQINVEPKESRPTAEHRAATSTDMNISLA